MLSLLFHFLWRIKTNFKKFFFHRTNTVKKFFFFFQGKKFSFFSIYWQQKQTNKQTLERQNENGKSKKKFEMQITCFWLLLFQNVLDIWISFLVNAPQFFHPPTFTYYLVLIDSDHFILFYFMYSKYKTKQTKKK